MELVLHFDVSFGRGAINTFGHDAGLRSRTREHIRGAKDDKEGKSALLFGSCWLFQDEESWLILCQWTEFGKMLPRQSWHGNIPSCS